MKKQVRFAGLFTWLDEKIERWQRRTAAYLNERFARMSMREQYAWFMGFCLVVSIICACIIGNLFK